MPQLVFVISAQEMQQQQKEVRRQQTNDSLNIAWEFFRQRFLKGKFVGFSLLMLFSRSSSRFAVSRIFLMMYRDASGSRKKMIKFHLEPKTWRRNLSLLKCQFFPSRLTSLSLIGNILLDVIKTASWKRKMRSINKQKTTLIFKSAVCGFKKSILRALSSR